MEVIYKVHPVFTDYEIGNDGSVYSLKCGKHTLLRPNSRTDGYLRIGLNKDCKQHRFLVHRLVADCFLPQSNDKQEINHIDGNKANNNADNLEWCTHSENCKHTFKILSPEQRKAKLKAVRLYTCGEKNHSAKLTNEKVLRIRELRSKGVSQKELAKQFGILQNAISRIVNRKRWNHI